MDQREERVVRNEMLFREVNERIESVSADVAVSERLELICECGEAACREPVALTRAEYEALRGEATHFAVVPGHEHPAFEHVVERHDGFWVVEKFGDAEETAEEQDPRS